MASITDPSEIARVSSGAYNPTPDDLQGAEAARMRQRLHDAALSRMDTPMVSVPMHPYGGARTVETPILPNSLDPRYGAMEATNGIAAIANRDYGNGIKKTINGVFDVAALPMMATGTGALAVAPRGIPAALGALALWNKGVQPLLDRGGEKLGMDPESIQAGSNLLGAVIPMHGMIPGGAGNLENRRISIGLDTGADSPLRLQHGVSSIPEGEMQWLIDKLADTFGVKVIARTSGKGAFMDDLEGSVHPQVIGTPDAVRNFMHAVGYVGEQTSVIGTRPSMDGKGIAIDLVSRGLDSDAERVQFYKDLKAAGAPARTVMGFQPFDKDGSPGMRFIYNPAWDDKPWTNEEIQGFKDAAGKVLGNRSYHAEVDHGPIDIMSSDNDWKELKDGQAYRQGLTDSGRHQELRVLDSQLRREFQERVKRASGSHSQASAGGQEAGSEIAASGNPAPHSAQPAVSGIGALALPESEGLAPFKKKDSSITSLDAAGPADIPGPRSGGITDRFPLMEMPVDEITKKLIRPGDGSYPPARAVFYPGEGGKDNHGTLMSTQDGVSALRDFGAQFWPGQYRQGRLVHGFALDAEASDRIKQSLYNGLLHNRWQNHVGKPLPKYFQDSRYQDEFLSPLFDALSDSPNLTVAAVNPHGGQWSPEQIAAHESIFHRNQFKLDPVARKDLSQLLPSEYMYRPNQKGQPQVNPEVAPHLAALGDALSATYPQSDMQAELGAWLGADMWHGLVPSEVASGAGNEYVKGLLQQHGEFALPLVRELVRSFEMQAKQGKLYRNKGLGLAGGGIVGDQGIRAQQEHPLVLAAVNGDDEAWDREWQKIFGSHEDYQKQYPHLYGRA